MSSGRKTVAAFFTVICGLLLTIIGLCADWPPQVWVIVGVLLVTALPLILKIMTTPRGHCWPGRWHMRSPCTATLASQTS